jgi:prophage regulatory protein
MRAVAATSPRKPEVDTAPLDRLIPTREVLRLSGKGRTNLYESVRNGSFPAPTKDGKATRWFESEVAAWVEAKKVNRSGKPPLSDCAAQMAVSPATG